MWILFSGLCVCHCRNAALLDEQGNALFWKTIDTETAKFGQERSETN